MVADPAKIASPVKTDTRDTVEMAKHLASNSIPAVWVPPPHVRELRAIVAHRQRLVRQRSAAKNRLNAVLQRHNLLPPSGDLWAAKQQAWWDTLALPPVERLRAQHDRATIQLALNPSAAIRKRLPPRPARSLNTGTAIMGEER